MGFFLQLNMDRPERLRRQNWTLLTGTARVSAALTTYVLRAARQPHGPLKISDFLLVAHCHDQRSFAVVAVQSHIPAVAKVDQPFPIFRFHLFGWPSDLGMLRKDLHTRPNCFYGPLGCVHVLLRQKAVGALNIA